MKIEHIQTVKWPGFKWQEGTTLKKDDKYSTIIFVSLKNREFIRSMIMGPTYKEKMNIKGTQSGRCSGKEINYSATPKIDNYSRRELRAQRIKEIYIYVVE